MSSRDASSRGQHHPARRGDEGCAGSGVRIPLSDGLPIRTFIVTHDGLSFGRAAAQCSADGTPRGLTHGGPCRQR